ncbi:MAG TPA: hypothetical protein VGC18_02430 [Lacisediminihabitans sp.]|uniref:hypothetical protein n=1 Tax=Lacisediminihabitans sp. TaxID=2787631 RepID=UPI002EDAEB0E
MPGSTRILTIVALTAGLAFAGSVPAVAGPVSPAAAAPSPSGTLELVTQDPAPGEDLVFSYTTDRPNTANWIGVYNDPSTGPTDQASHGASSDWAYLDSATARSSGTVTVPSDGLTPGRDITAYLLYDDGYTWLAQPVTFHVGYPTTGTLALTTVDPTVGDSLEFTFTTGKDNDAGKDWVGIYDDPAKSPVDQTYPDVGSSEWSYVSGTSGSVSIPSDKLTAGHDVIAYLLYDDGYTWLAQPIVFRLSAAPSAPTDDGTLALTTTDPVVGQKLEFSYTTTTPNSENWIGIYQRSADFPSGYVTWSWAPGASGTVSVSTSGLSAGDSVTAYLLYDNGYTALAKPVTFGIRPAPPLIGSATPTTPHFVTDDLTAPAAAPASTLSMALGGLWFGVNGQPVSSTATFAKVSGPDWLTVAADGSVSGTTPSRASARPAVLEVSATDTNGVTGTLDVEVPLSPPGTVPRVKAATLSMWDAGSHVDNPQEKLVRSIIVNGLTLVGLQQTGGTQAAAIAHLLGWNAVETPGGEGVISPFPVAADTTAVPATVPAAKAVVTIGTKRVTVWDAALDAVASTRSLACDGNGTTAIGAEKATLRYAQAVALAGAVSDDLGGGASVILLGDLESPSHLDWTAATSAAHCEAGAVDWPVSSVLERTGLKDSFRLAHPDPSAAPGQTTSVFTGHAVSATAAATPADADRLDYVDFAGDLTVLESHVLTDGFPKPAPDSAGNGWISDRAAVVTTFDLVADTGDGPGDGGHPADPGTGPHGSTRPAGWLPFTGASIGGLVLVGLGLLAAGTIVVIRRRRTITDQKEPRP